jgi:hypothetical protein
MQNCIQNLFNEDLTFCRNVGIVYVTLILSLLLS